MKDHTTESGIAQPESYEPPKAVPFGDAVDLTLGSSGATPDGSAFTSWGSFGPAETA